MPVVFDNPHLTLYRLTEAELRKRQEERQVLDKKIRSLRTVLDSLRPCIELGPDPELQNKSIAQLIVMAIELAGQPVTATGIRDQLKRMGIIIQGQNPMAMIWTNLDRLIRRPNSGIMRIDREDQKPMFTIKR